VADALGFHLNTVSAAFREAARLGLISSGARRGSVVSGTQRIEREGRRSIWL
jgi:DNA-binding transcriptional regulator YhcF (GntR family)